MIRRFCWWLLALAPMFAAIGWATFSSDLPEPHAAREALGEMRTVWSFAEWDRSDGGPVHVAARALHLAVLRIPGATIASAVWVNVLCALLLATTLFSIARRSFAEATASLPACLLLMATIGMLAASPGHGSNWLHGERVGVLAAPMLLVLGLAWLQGGGRPALRRVAALSIAALAPLCHANGIAVFLALVPAMISKCRDGGNAVTLAWVGVLLVVGNVAAWFALHTADAFGAVGVDLLHQISSEPRETLGRLLAETGAAWLDVLPETQLDEQAMGVFSWCLPLLLMIPFGRRDQQARRQAAPWWGCLWFGLTLVLIAGFRYGFEPTVGSLREATYGAFLLPVGAIGLLASRFGTQLLPIAAGALAVLALQDWHQGLEDLRLARMRVARSEAEVALRPDLVVATFGASNVEERLRERGWLPTWPPVSTADAGAALLAAARNAAGSCVGGSPQRVSGTLRSSLRGSTAGWLGVVAKAPGAEPELVQDHFPVFEGAGRTVPWQIDLAAPLAEGAQLRVVAWFPQERAFAPLGPRFVVRAGALVVDNGS